MDTPSADMTNAAASAGVPTGASVRIGDDGGAYRWWVWPLVWCAMVGLVVTVLVAWACALFSTVTRRDVTLRTGEAAAQAGWPAPPARAIGAVRPPVSLEIAHGFGVATVSASGQGPGASRLWMTAHLSGWPFLSMCSATQVKETPTRLVPEPLGQGELLEGVAWPKGWPRNEFGFAELPLVPRWSGFAACWALYSASGFGAVLGGRAWRRKWRRSRGRCPGCGYPRSLSRCPECGASGGRRRF